MTPSFSFKKIINKQYQLPVHKVLLVIGIIKVVGIFLLFNMTNSKVPVESPVQVPNSMQIVSASPHSILSTGTQVAQVKQAEQITRDPFAKPPEILEQKNNSNPISSPTVHNVSSQMLSPASNTVLDIPYEKIKLMGIVSTIDKQLAVIMSNKKSQSYSLNEMIGTYKLVMIGYDSVILENGNDTVVLRLE